MSQTSEAPDRRQWIEYDWRRPGVRLTFALAAVVSIAFYNYGLDEFSPDEFGPGVVCSGGLSGALKFGGALLFCVFLIEALNWSVWGAQNQEALEAQEQEQQSRQPGNTGATTEGAATIPEYTLVVTGGRLLLAPKGTALGLLFAAIAATTALVIGLPDICTGPELTVLSWSRYLASGFALLALISFAENRAIDSLDKTEKVSK
jgi:hypothetical protein